MTMDVVLTPRAQPGDRILYNNHHKYYELFSL